MPGKAKTLTQQELQFIRNMRRGMTKQRAALEAGYGRGTNMKAASVAAARLLKRDRVKKAIEAANKRAITRADITTDRVLAEWARIAFFDPASLVDAGPNGEPIAKPFEQWSEDETRALAEIEVDKDGRTKFKPNNKIKALAALTRMLDPELDDEEVDEERKVFAFKIGEE